jgi:hypothetical protein
LVRQTVRLIFGPLAYRLYDQVSRPGMVSAEELASSKPV